MIDNAFEKRVRKFFRKRGWEAEESYIFRMVIRREVFRLHILFGPQYYDLRFPIVDSVLTKEVFAVRDSCGAGTPNILMVVRDRNTMSFYERLTFDNFVFLHEDDLHLAHAIDLDRLTALEPDAEAAWADRFIKMNVGLSKQVAEHAVERGHYRRADYWAGLLPPDVRKN